MGGVKVHPTMPAPWYEFEMLNADDKKLFLHYQVPVVVRVRDAIRVSTHKCHAYCIS